MLFNQNLVCSAIILCSVPWFILAQNWRDLRPTVQTEQGLIQGSKMSTYSGKTVNAFLGVPYAAPPLGDLRFSLPREHQFWNGTRTATEYSPHCPQLPIKPGVNDQEDCLYLNIWSPENSGLYAAPLPVVVFFEGVDFYKSSGYPISGQDFAGAENLIVITVNYRLNIFGFFSLGSPEARGNLGLLDQYYALLWIRKNIKAFGGDADKITLYGHSSGAVSVLLHMISPRTAGLFQKVILSAGSVTAPWLNNNDPILASKQILRMLGCDAYNADPLNCIKNKKVEHILQALNEYTESYNWNDRFYPLVDSFLRSNNQYLPNSPLNALRDGTFLQVPILTGVSIPIADEQFEQWMELASQGYTQLQQYTEKAKIYEILRLYKFSNNAKDQIFDLIKWKYFSANEGDVRALFEQLKRLEYEAKLEAPFFHQLAYFSSTYLQPIYVYMMDDIGFYVNTTDSVITTDLLLIFGPILFNQVARRRFNVNENNLSRHVKELWTNFIMYGNPTPNNQMKQWRKYVNGDTYIENINMLMNSVDKEKDSRNSRIQFWNSLLPKIANIRNNFSNYIPRELQNSPDPAAGFRHAMYTLVALVIALLALLLICVILLKKRSKQRENHLQMGY